MKCLYIKTLQIKYWSTVPDLAEEEIIYQIELTRSRNKLSLGTSVATKDLYQVLSGGITSPNVG